MTRIALTQTLNAYRDMPSSVDQLDTLSGRLDELRQANLDHTTRLIGRAAERGAKLVLLGELFSGPYFALRPIEMWFDLAESAKTGPSVSHMREVARQRRVIIVAPIYERDDQSGKRFNTAVVIDERGELLGSYRKTHVPNGSNEAATFSESYYYQPSDGEMFVEAAHNASTHRHYPVFKTSIGPIGVAICYDRHFDGVMRTLADGGAKLVLCPAVTFGNKSQRMWRAESATDACRHRIYVGLQQPPRRRAPMGRGILRRLPRDGPGRPAAQPQRPPRARDQRRRPRRPQKTRLLRLGSRRRPPQRDLRSLTRATTDPRDH